MWEVSVGITLIKLVSNVMCTDVGSAGGNHTNKTSF